MYFISYRVIKEKLVNYKIEYKFEQKLMITHL